MKNFFLITVVFLSIPVIATAEDNKAIMASDQWCPYTCDSKNKEYLGFSVELIREALKINGWTTEYVNAPFMRVNNGVLKGTFQILPATVSSSSPDLRISKEPVAYQRNVFIVKKGMKWKYNGIESLEKVTIGVVTGYSYSPDVDEYIKMNQSTKKIYPLFSDQSQEQNFKKLIIGRIDAYLEDENVIRYWAEKLDLADKIEIAGFVHEFPVYCGLGKDEKAKKLSEILDDGIRKLQKTETMKKLVEKYKISNWKHGA